MLLNLISYLKNKIIPQKPINSFIQIEEQLEIDSLLFNSFYINSISNSEYQNIHNIEDNQKPNIKLQDSSIPLSLLGLDVNKEFLIKIQIWHDPRKRNNLENEINIIDHLDKLKSTITPKLISRGSLNINYRLLKKLNFIECGGINFQFDYMIMNFINGQHAYLSANKLLPYLFYLRDLGIHHGDLKPSNIILFDKKIYFIDFDQSVLLNHKQISKTNEHYQLWMDNYELQYYGYKSWKRNFGFLNKIKYRKRQKNIDELFNVPDINF